MFSILFYISLPVAFCIHELEEQLLRRKWEKKYYDKIITQYPILRNILSLFRSITPLEYAIVDLEQFMFLAVAVVLGIYADPIPMCGIFWGFFIHLVFYHLVVCLIFRTYYPGSITSVLLLPYFYFGIRDLLVQFTLVENLIMALTGTVIIFLNLSLMYWLMKKFGDL